MLKYFFTLHSISDGSRMRQEQRFLRRSLRSPPTPPPPLLFLPRTHARTHAHIPASRRFCFANECARVPACVCVCMQSGAPESVSRSLGAYKERACGERKQVEQMEFFTGVRPFSIFTYVLINGILVTLQSKEGECHVLFQSSNLPGVDCAHHAESVEETLKGSAASRLVLYSVPRIFEICT